MKGPGATLPSWLAMSMTAASDVQPLKICTRHCHHHYKSPVGDVAAEGLGLASTVPEIPSRAVASDCTPAGLLPGAALLLDVVSGSSSVSFSSELKRSPQLACQGLGSLAEDPCLGVDGAVGGGAVRGKSGVSSSTSS